MAEHKNDDTLSFEDLELRLCNIAAKWRANKGDEEKRRQLVEEYHMIVAKLFDRKIDAEIHIECELPDELMPDEYLRKYPKIFRS